jgi:hypothetical protein
MGFPSLQAGLVRQSLDTLQGLNLCAIRLALRRSPMLRTYISTCLRRFDDMAGNGLPVKNPIAGLEEGTGQVLSVPLQFKTGGGTDTLEILTLAAIAKVRKPRRVFEIGTYNGKTTSVFLLNTPEESQVFTLDLPPSGGVAENYLPSDVELVNNRRTDDFLVPFRSSERYHQLYCDSKLFDPEPFRDSIDLGFIDGAHTRDFVQNDTEKMAIMMAPDGLVLWHDYGGKGSFRPLADYLESLPCAMCRITGTSLAWTTGAEIKKLAPQLMQRKHAAGRAA